MNRIAKAFVSSLRVALAVVFALAAFAPFVSNIPTVCAVSPNVVIAQVYGGGGNSGAPYNRDFVVLFNRGDGVASLKGMSIQYTSPQGTGNFSSHRVALPDVSLAPGQSFLVQLSGGDSGAALPTPDVTGTIAMGAAGGKVALVNSTDGLECNGNPTPCSPEQAAWIVDLVGYGNANYYEGVAAPAPSNTTAIHRLNNGCTDTDTNSSDFQVRPPEPRNLASPHTPCGGGDTAPYVITTTPGSNASGIALDASAAITFNEPVNAPTSAFSVACSISGQHAVSVSGGPVTFTLDPSGDFIRGESCTVTILAAQVTDQDSQDPPDQMWVNYRWSFTTLPQPAMIHEIQGAGHISPLNNRLVVDVPGIVTARTSDGFMMQDPNPDAAPATSEAIFVYTDSLPNVQVGDAVLVAGKVSEYRPGNDSDNLTITELTNPTLTVLASGNSLPAPVEIGAGGRVPPGSIIEDDANGDVEASGSFDPDQDGLDFYESMESMRVQVNNALVVGPTNGFGEVPVIGDLGANAGLLTPRGGLVIRPGDFNPERILLDDALLPARSMPAMNVGDRISGALIGVMDYGYSLYRVQVEQAPSFTPGGISREVAQEPGEDQLAVASFNTENLSFKDEQARFDRLAVLILNNLRAPDVLALEEIQDNSGSTDDGVVEANLTLTRLVDAIASKGGPQYSFRQINPVNDQDGGEDGGNIRVAFLFRTDRGVSFVDRPGGSSTEANGIIVNETGVHLKYNPGRIAPADDAFAHSRKPLAGEFQYNGQRIFIIANHFNSKGGDQPLFGRFQPPVLSSETQRLKQAQIVHDFVYSILALNPRANVIVLGDLNDFQFSNPLAVLKGNPAILTTLIDTLPEAERYSYIYQGNAQAIDHILVSSALAARPLVYDSIHVNTEFVDQDSDHDPQLLIITLKNYPVHLPVIRR